MSNRSTVTFRRIASILPMIFMAAGCNSMHTVDSHANEAEEKAQWEIEQRLHEVFRACTSKDFDRLESYHLYGPKFTRFSGLLPVRLDAVSTRKLEHDGLASLNGLKMEAEGLKIDVFETVGIATFILHYSYDVGGDTVQASEQTTLVFIAENGEWRIAHEHLSPVKIAEPGNAASGSLPIRPESNQTIDPIGFRC